LGRVSHLWFGFGNFPLKIQNFQFFALWVKKISVGRVKKYLDQSQVGLLFTAGKRYARVGQGLSLTEFYYLKLKKLNVKVSTQTLLFSEESKS